MYLCVVLNNERSVSAWTSRNEPPTVEMRLAVFVMNVLRPEWLEHD